MKLILQTIAIYWKDFLTLIFGEKKIEVDTTTLPKTPCASHKLHGWKTDAQWSAWAIEQINKGNRQKQCPHCGRWLFAEEF